MQDTAVAALGLTKRFRPDRAAVEDLSFRVERGHVCGLLGPNGAGKTTTLRMLLGLVHPNAGTCEILGERMRPGHPVLSKVGSLVERPAFIPHLPGMVNLKLHWRAGGGSWPPPALDEALGIAGLGNDVDRNVKTYSQGMRQRLGIAQALMGKPEALVLDEPTNGLDPGEMREIRQLLRSLAGSSTSVLVSSHLLGEIEQSCTHAVVMHHGRLVAAGSVGELVGATDMVYVEVDDREAARRALSKLRGVKAVTDDGAGLVVELDGIGRPQMVAALVRAKAAVQTVTSRNRLEETFLGLVEQDG